MTNRLPTNDSENPGNPEQGGEKQPEKPLTAAQKRAKAKEEKAKRQAEKTAAKEKAQLAVASEKWPAFNGKDSLPKDVKTSKRGKVLARGSARYALRMTGSGTYKLLAFFRNGKGVATALVKVLKPMKKTARGLRDKALLKALTASKVPLITE